MQEIGVWVFIAIAAAFCALASQSAASEYACLFWSSLHKIRKIKSFHNLLHCQNCKYVFRNGLILAGTNRIRFWKKAQLISIYRGAGLIAPAAEAEKY